ncbi:MAG: phosphocholine cytidylyltransferase family protein [Planctomycetota bacterium]
MKAIILAAGMGKRLAEIGWDQPKCLLGFSGRPLLNLMLSAVGACGIDRVVVVVGYRQELIRQAVASAGVQAEFVINDDYADTNTVHSLYLAREHLNDDFIYFNADVLFDARILPMLMDGEGGRLAVDVKHCGDEEVKVIVDSAGRIERIGKALPVADCLGEFIGIGKFAADACGDFVEALIQRNEVAGQRNLFFESAADDILKRQAHWAVDIGDLQAVEIDTPEDLAAARAAWDAGDIESA